MVYWNPGTAPAAKIAARSRCSNMSCRKDPAMKKQLLCFLLALAVTFGSLSLTVLALGETDTGASGTGDGHTDAMPAIREALDTDYRIGDTVTVENDGYIGIPVKMTTYFDKSRSADVRGGYRGTPILLYVINTQTERVGTTDDVTLIRGMLDRGYIVIVTDYMNHALADTPALDWSTYQLRVRTKKGEFFDGTVIPKRKDYTENFIVPAGCDVLLNQVYWEIDKHSVAGILEKIVEIWNNDFKGIHGNKTVYWLDEDGNRKATTNDAVWEDESHIKLKYTIARDIYDCVKKDGTPIDLNLYMHIIYPSHPAENVPVMCLASSAEDLIDAWFTADRPHLTGFLFRGYAGVLYDYAYVPMGRSDHYGYFDGNGAANQPGWVTGDNYTYSIQMYNDKKNNTAALRYLRWLADGQPETYAFATERIGVYGNSKAGIIPFLGNPRLEELREMRFFPGRHGETRYDVGETGDDGRGIIDGGTEQPWLTGKDGKKLASGANFVYANCGGNDFTITEGSAPMYATGSMVNNYAFYPPVVNNCRTADVPCLYFSVPTMGHTIAKGTDRDYGLDVYNEFFDYADYWLRGCAAKVVYVDPVSGTEGVGTTDRIKVKFTGSVSAGEIQKVRIVSRATGKIATGTWECAFGKTEWIFTPDGLESHTVYDIVIPDTITDTRHAKGLRETYTASFVTEYEMRTDAVEVIGTRADNKNGIFFRFCVENTGEKTFLRFYAEGTAANTAVIFPVTSFADGAPETSVLGDALTEVTLTGEGWYEADVSAAFAGKAAGDTVILCLRTGRRCTEKNVSKYTFDNLSGVNIHTLTRATLSEDVNVSARGSHSLKAEYTSNSAGKHGNKYTGDGKYPYHNFVSNPVIAFSLPEIITPDALTEADFGRTFTISLKIYDTTTRFIRIALSGVSLDLSCGENCDFHANTYGFFTKPGEWVTFTFTYTVSDPFYYGKLQKKELFILMETTGDRTVREGEEECTNPYAPIYFDDVVCTETVSAITLGSGRPVSAVSYGATAGK